MHLNITELEKKTTKQNMHLNITELQQVLSEHLYIYIFSW